MNWFDISGWSSVIPLYMRHSSVVKESLWIFPWIKTFLISFSISRNVRNVATLYPKHASHLVEYFIEISHWILGMYCSNHPSCSMLILIHDVEIQVFAIKMDCARAVRYDTGSGLRWWTLMCFSWAKISKWKPRGHAWWYLRMGWIYFCLQWTTCKVM